MRAQPFLPKEINGDKACRMQVTQAGAKAVSGSKAASLLPLLGISQLSPKGKFK